VDLHRKRSHIVALDSTGEVVLSRRIGNAPAEFLRIFGELEPEPIEVVFEATYGWSWFADLLADVGIAAHLAHPLATKAISAARVTNDAVDAKTLAHLLGTNLLAEAWIAPPDAREARRLVRTRLGWSGCAPGSNLSCPRCWPTWGHPRAHHPVRPGRAPLARRTTHACFGSWSTRCRPAPDRRHHRRGRPCRR